MIKIIGFSETAFKILKKLPVFFLNNPKLFDNFFPLFCQKGTSSPFSTGHSIYQWFFSEVIDHIDKMPGCFITDSDSFRCAVDRAKLIDFFNTTGKRIDLISHWSRHRWRIAPIPARCPSRQAE